MVDAKADVLELKKPVTVLDVSVEGEEKEPVRLVVEFEKLLAVETSVLCEVVEFANDDGVTLELVEDDVSC